MIRKSLAAVVMVTALSLAVNADVDEAKIALQSDRYEDAIRILSSSDDPSDPEAAHLLAVSLLGIVNKRSIQIEGDDFWLPGEKERVERLLKIGAANNYAPAQLELAMFLSIGQDEVSNESWGHVVDAFNNGHALAAAMLFGQYCEGKSQPVADQMLIARVRELAYFDGDSDQEPNTYSAYFGALDDDVVIGGIGADYALALATGGCIPKDRQAALTLFDHLLARNQERSALASAIREAVERYEGSWLADTTPNGVGEDRVEAIFWLNYLAGHGLANSHDYASLAEYHLNEKYVPLDLSAAYTSLEKCYEYARPAEYLSCFGSTSYNLAKKIYKTPPDATRYVSLTSVLKTPLAINAEQILILVAQRDDAKYFNYKQDLADLYYWGEAGSETPLDYDAAFPLYKELADKGYESSQFRVAWMYSQGEGTPKNGNEAVRYYQMAASAGDKTAQFNLGVTFGNGEGVPKDEKSAVYWLRKAAEQGYSPAENLLGVMISEG